MKLIKKYGMLITPLMMMIGLILVVVLGSLGLWRELSYAYAGCAIIAVIPLLVYLVVDMRGERK